MWIRIYVNARWSTGSVCVKADLAMSASNVCWNLSRLLMNSVFENSPLPETEIWNFEDEKGCTGDYFGTNRSFPIRFGGFNFSIGKNPIWFYVYNSFRVIYLKIFTFPWKGGGVLGGNLEVVVIRGNWWWTDVEHRQSKCWGINPEGSLPMVSHLPRHATGTGRSPLINIAGWDDNHKRSQELYLRICYSVFNGLFYRRNKNFPVTWRDNCDR